MMTGRTGLWTSGSLAVVMAGRTVDPEVLEVVIVGHLQLDGVGLVMTVRTGDLEVFSVHLMREYDLADGRW